MINDLEAQALAMIKSEVPIAQPRIAFLILAHSDTPLLLRLCNHFQDHAVFVHLDAKSRDFPIEQLAALTNVVLVKPQVAVHWGDFSMIEATLALLRSALDRDERFSKLVLISGGCYPVKPINQLASLFRGDGGHNYIRFTPILPSSFLGILVSRHWIMTPLLPDALMARQPWLRAVEKNARVFLNKLSSYRPRGFQREIGVQPYFGSQWWAISEPCARYILAFVKDNPAFSRAYRSTYAPDEQFYHTIIMQSPFAATTDGAQADEGIQTNQATPLHLIHPSEKRTFGYSETDFELAQTTDKYLIRKVTLRDSGGLLDRIDRELL
jgi:Core-2/I-Branching enzyme